jgi:hypothetical protein
MNCKQSPTKLCATQQWRALVRILSIRGVLHQAKMASLEIPTQSLDIGCVEQSMAISEAISLHRWRLPADLISPHS